MNGNRKAIKLLLVVGTAKDVFIYNYVKWLKNTLDNLSVDIFEYHPDYTNSIYGNSNYEIVYSKDSGNNVIMKIKGIRGIVEPFIIRKDLKNTIKGKQYSIIHCHNITPAIVISSFLKNHCDKLVLTFWGGELEKGKLLLSHQLYLYFLAKILKSSVITTNSNVLNDEINTLYPCTLGKTRIANLGSAPLECLNEIMIKEEKETSKRKLGIASDKTTLLIGYSGKSIHQHICIIKELGKDRDILKDKIHLLAPMTRGASKEYIKEVEDELKKCGFSYTLYKDKYMTDEEIARLRNATDIVFQLSLFDAFSRTIIECLAAKALMLYGNWLGYDKKMKEEALWGLEVASINEAIEKLPFILNNFENYILNLEENKKNAATNYLWRNCIKAWCDVYLE